MLLRTPGQPSPDLVSPPDLLPFLLSLTGHQHIAQHTVNGHQGLRH